LKLKRLAMQKRKFSVFISSTFQDLAEYRSLVVDAVLRTGAVPIGLEAFPASGRTIAETLDGLVSESDAVLMIVGHRYGEIDPGTGVSWTEVEYATARRLAKPLLVFLADDKAPWEPRFIDSDRTRIQAFRARIASDLVVRVFSGPADPGIHQDAGRRLPKRWSRRRGTDAPARRGSALSLAGSTRH
jgi:nucleoside 2-deoxyribosyltransferase